MWKRSDKRFSKSFHIIETLSNSQYVKPITYSDEILASTFHNKFKQKTGIVLKDIPTSNFKEPNETNYVPKKVMRYFMDFETCPNEKKRRWNKCKT